MNSLGNLQTENELKRRLLLGDWEWFDYRMISVKNRHPFYQLKYRQEAQWIGHNDFTRLCRGRIYQIIDGKRAEIAALPFPKFFNYGERDMFPKDSGIKKIMEKMDGSLAIVWFNKVECKWEITTQQGLAGNFDRQSAMDYAFEKVVKDHTKNFDRDTTYLFEYIGKDNRHVVNYDFDYDLSFLASIDNRTGIVSWFFEYNPWYFNTPNIYNFSLEYMQKLLAELPKDSEGFVAIFEDGSVWKFKGKEYLEYHKFLFQVTRKKFLRFMNEQPMPKTAEEITEREHKYLAMIPEEYHREVEGWMMEVWQETSNGTIFEIIIQEIYDTFQPLPDKRTIAQYVMDKYGQQWVGDIVTYLFQGRIPFYRYALDEIT